MLYLHFIGLAMGIGTSFGHMFLGIASAKLPPEDRIRFGLHAFALSRAGQIGIVLLVLSGGYLMTPYWGALMDTPLLLTKLILVLFLIIMIIVIHSIANKAKRGDAATHFRKIAPLGRISLLTGLVIVLLAVLVFR